MGWPGPLTHRQYLAWQAWLDGDYDRPSRADFYAMQVASEVRRTLVKKPGSVRLDQFRLKFGGGGRRKANAERVALSKRAWMHRLGMAPAEHGGDAHGREPGAGNAGGKADGRRQRLPEDPR